MLPLLLFFVLTVLVLMTIVVCTGVCMQFSTIAVSKGNDAAMLHIVDNI